MVSVFKNATLDLTVSNLTPTFPDLQKERTHTRAQKSVLLSSEKPHNSQQTKGPSSLKLRNI